MKMSVYVDSTTYGKWDDGKKKDAADHEMS